LDVLQRVDFDRLELLLQIFYDVEILLRQEFASQSPDLSQVRRLRGGGRLMVSQRSDVTRCVRASSLVGSWL
jgi:hypothetical protein